MRTELCERLGIEVPIFAFTHCRDDERLVSEYVDAVERLNGLAARA